MPSDQNQPDTFATARCRYCEQKHDVDTDGRLKPHTPPFRSDACAGSGRSPEVHFRRIEHARHVRDLAANRTAIWGAYTTGGIEVGRWCEQRGYAWGHQLASVSYRNWRKCVSDGIER